MMSTTKKVLIFWFVVTGLLLSILTYLRLTVGGACVYQPATAENFDREAYLGSWYEMVRTNTFEEGDCATAEYYEIPGNFISVNNFEYNLENPELSRDWS